MNGQALEIKNNSTLCSKEDDTKIINIGNMHYTVEGYKDMADGTIQSFKRSTTKKLFSSKRHLALLF